MLIVLLVGLVCFEALAASVVRIKSSNDYYNFLFDVTFKGIKHTGTTVFLDSDLSLSDISISIGDHQRWFEGVFDGQGHVISNIKIASSSVPYPYHVGMFGNSNGMTIRNVVLGASCSITSTYEVFNSLYVGGIVGLCKSEKAPCVIENCVNMGSVNFYGKTGTILHHGGIIGSISSSNFDSVLRNCANYGQVMSKGVGFSSNIGGIVGSSSGSSGHISSIYNSISYGLITHWNATDNWLGIGGIVGHSSYTSINNCVSISEINSNRAGNIAGIVGFVRENTYINHCYYPDGITGHSEYVDSIPFVFESFKYDKPLFRLTQNISLGDYTGSSLVDALNACVDSELSYSRWILNKENKNLIFTINGWTTIKMNYKIILAPSLANEGNASFNGWYTNPECTESYEASEITSDTRVYSKFSLNVNNYTITFDPKGGSPVPPLVAQFGTVVSLPMDVSREECLIAFWETEKGFKVGFNFTLPARDITLYAVYRCLHIKSSDDFIDFSKVVNTGTDSYNGSTVFLESDVLLSDKVGPIGPGPKFQFLGTFDGQGHTISNFVLSLYSSTYVGLFGYSEGTTIRNVILDSSCSISNSYSSSNNVYMGSVIAYCESDNECCRIENNVNLASMTFNGNISSNLFLGGISGYVHSTSFESMIRNCANYGIVVNSGAGSFSYIGGFVGIFELSYSKTGYIQNCLNYGKITNSGTFKETYLGGIIGLGSPNVIENCVSSGRISYTRSAKNDYIGSILGSSTSSVIHCFWTTDVGLNNSYQTGTKSPKMDNETSQVELDSEFVRKLNAYSVNNSWNKWYLNRNNASVSFSVNNGKGFNLKSQIILLPNPAESIDASFSGWYTDGFLISPFIATEVESEVTLYGMFCEPSKYVVTLDVNKGDPSSLPSSHPMAIECNGFYGKLPIPTREGHAFAGWFTAKEAGDKIESGSKVINLNSHVLYAQWGQPTNQVEIVFMTKDLTEEKVSEIIVKYTNEKITITRVEDSESGEIRIIVKFEDPKKAEKFVREISSSGYYKEIKKINFIFRPDASSAFLASPVMLINLFIV